MERSNVLRVLISLLLIVGLTFTGCGNKNTEEGAAGDELRRKLAELAAKEKEADQSVTASGEEQEADDTGEGTEVSGATDGQEAEAVGSEPEFSFDDKTFTYNGREFKVTDFATGATAIMDATRVGRWIIVDCHVNPHQGIYMFFNTDSADFEYEVVGANLIWREDDLSTAVYSRYNEIYDIWGHMLGSVQEGEVFGLEFVDDMTVAAECWMIKDGEEIEFNEEFEHIPSENTPVWQYFEATFFDEKEKEKYLAEQPVNAAALVIVNPPAEVLNHLSEPVTLVEGAFDRVAVVSLMDDQTFHIESLDPVLSGNNKYYGQFYDCEKGSNTVFTVTVPEGMPVDELVVSTPGYGEVFWDICTLSGRTPQMCTYLIAGD